MTSRKTGALLLAAALSIGGLFASSTSQAQSTRVFELRTYTTNDGKLNQNWDAFRKDPEWVAARTASEASGTILAKPPVFVFMDPVAFSAIK